MEENKRDKTNTTNPKNNVSHKEIEHAIIHETEKKTEKHYFRNFMILLVGASLLLILFFNLGETNTFKEDSSCDLTSDENCEPQTRVSEVSQKVQITVINPNQTKDVNDNVG